MFCSRQLKQLARVETNRFDTWARLELPWRALKKYLSETFVVGRQGDIHKPITVDIVGKSRKGPGIKWKISDGLRGRTLFDRFFGAAGHDRSRR